MNRRFTSVSLSKFPAPVLGRVASRALPPLPARAAPLFTLALGTVLTWELLAGRAAGLPDGVRVALVILLAAAACAAAVRRRPRPEPDDQQLLLRTLCHELRTPLTALEGLASALGRPDLDARAEVADLARQQARHAQLVLGWVSDLSNRVSAAGRPALRPLGDVVAAAADAAGVGAGRLQVELSLRACARSTWTAIWCNAS